MQNFSQCPYYSICLISPLRSAGGRGERCPSWLCLRICWLVFEVLRVEQGNRAQCSLLQAASLCQDLLGMGPPGQLWSSQPDGLSSVRGSLCLSSLWSLVSDLSPRPLSPSPPLSLSLVLYPPPLCQSSCPRRLPSSPSPPLHILSNVDGQGHGHKDLTSTKRVSGSVLVRSEGDAQTLQVGWSKGRNRGNQGDLSCMMLWIRAERDGSAGHTP